MRKEVAGYTSKAIRCSRNAARLGYEMTENDKRAPNLDVSRSHTTTHHSR